MLHSLQYYACCYALLCLLHQQQRAAALTIIIDGATTNEWSTRDEYRRMLDSSNVLESSLNQQQQQQQQQQDQQDQQDQQLDYEQQPLAPALRQLNERGSAPQHFCGNDLMDALELVCQGRYYNHEIEPQIAQPSIKTKRASRSRSISSSSSSSFQPIPQSQSPPLSLSSSSSSSKLSSSSSLKPHHTLSISQQQQQPPIVQSDGELDIYSIDANGGSRGNQQIEGNRQQLRMMQLEAEQLLPAHLTIGNNKHQTNDNNNNGDTTINSHNNYNNINSLTNKPRNRYIRMVLNRRIRGASEECCKHACELDDLKAYCKLD